ncbi:uncharacterized protein LOC132855700 [Tachysurus vachellii]|uniref:uncharacterized protein LOC132855700 n=1 Tax=Tachysurus vachellii TaxID=175792 RepID=UPI00296B223F|nr:uncharacterized protein LOC132855700 [Tachysurus vachellii]
MSSFWILLFIFSTMYMVHPGRHWVTAQSVTKPPVYQPDKELSVNIGDSATLQCCYDSQNVVGIIDLFKQPNNKKPQIVVTVYKTAGEAFHTGFKKSRFQLERSSNCSNIIILNTIQSDEAMYYCAVKTSNIVFGDGTYLQIKGDHVTIASETSKAALCDNSVVREPTPHGNNTNTNIQHNTDTVESYKRCVTTKSPPNPDVYQAEEKLSVNIGASATLQCCVLGIENGEVIWFKQQNEKQPQVIVRFFNTAGEMFYKEFQNSRFQIKRFGHCFNLTILNTTLCDEATYYCALVSTDGTRLQMKGRISTETNDGTD